MKNAEAKKLRRFEVHGAVFRGVTGPDNDGDYHSTGDCPFCGRRGKFYVNQTTLKWDCKVCQLNGDYKTYLKAVAERNADQFRKSPEAQQKLADDRKLKRKTLREAGFGVFGDMYTLPIYHGEVLVDLMTYRIGQKIRSAIGGNKGIFGVNDIRKGSTIWVAEGVWDALAGRELFERAGIDGVDFVGMPGADVFFPKWAGFFNNRQVNVIYDADGKENEYAAQKGAARINKVLHGVAKKLRFVHWPERYTNGFDLRDFVSSSKNSKKAVAMLQKFLKSAPPEIPKPKRKAVKRKKKKVERIVTREELIKEFKKWLYLTDDEVEVLDVIFGTIYANRLEGDPLWLFLVGPPGCGKTELLFTLSKSDSVVTVTTLTVPSLISGAQLKDGADPSLIPQLDGMILVIKDFTTILSMRQTDLQEIFGILRDAYDGRIKKTFGTGVVRDYESKFGILAGVTHHINAFHANTTVGERFLRYNVRHFAQSAGSKALIEAAIGNINREGRMREELQEIAQLAADREVDGRLPVASKFWRERIVALAQWISFMRGAVMRDKYSDEVIYHPAAEIGTRVAKQFSKLAMGIALFRNERILGEDIYRVIVRVARDTAPDRVESIAKTLYLNDMPLTASKISDNTKLENATVRKVLHDLRLLRIVDKHGGGSHWRLTAKMRRMIDAAEIYVEEAKWKKAGKSKLKKGVKRVVRRRKKVQ